MREPRQVPPSRPRTVWRVSRDGAMVVGITGGVASGKSCVTRLLEARGAVAFSADDAARAVLTRDGPVFRQLVLTFGAEVLAEDGALDRAKLGELIFSNAEARGSLNRLTHPAILRLLRAQIDAARKDLPAGSVIAVEVPLLFETNLAGWFERIVVVAASEPTQIARLKARNGLGEPEARRRLASQLPIHEKILRADFVIRNDGSAVDLEAAVERLWEELKQSEPKRI